MALLKNLAERVLKDDLQAMTESIGKLAEAVTTLQSEERGWINVSNGMAPWEMTSEQRQLVLKKLREAYKRNPMAGGIVDIKRYFTTGQGISFKAEEPEVQEVLKQFWQDESNKWFQRQSQLSDDLEIDGEIYLRFFESGITGRVQVRCIPAWQITDIITDPDDSENALFYKREWTEQRWDKDSKLYVTTVDHTGLNADFIPAEEVIYVKVGTPLYAKFGNAPLYRTLSYLNAYKEWLEDRVKLNKAKSAFAWKKKIKSATSAISGAINGVQNALNKLNKGDIPVPPKTGGVIVENDSVEWSVIKADIGADNAAEDGRAIKLMICAGSGIFEHYLGDAKVGNLASTKSMELPMLKMFEWRQKLFEMAIFKPMFRRVIRAAIEAGNLPEKVKVTRQVNGKEVEFELPTDQVNIDIDFPPLVLKEVKDLTDALVKQVDAGFKSCQTAGMELGIEDWAQEKTLMVAESEDREAKARENEVNKYPEFNPPKPGKKKVKNTEEDEDGEE